MLTLTREVHLENAYLPIEVTPSGMLTLVRFVLVPKALSMSDDALAIAVTLYVCVSFVTFKGITTAVFDVSVFPDTSTV